MLEQFLGLRQFQKRTSISGDFRLDWGHFRLGTFQDGDISGCGHFRFGRFRLQSADILGRGQWTLQVWLFQVADISGAFQVGDFLG